MPQTACDYVDPSFIASDHERRRPNALECIPQLPARRAHIVRLVRHTHHVIQRALERLERQAGAVVTHRYTVRLDRDSDIRRGACLLAGIEGVINQFLEQDDRPE